MKKVLITGCAGFIASSVIKLLLEKDYHILGFDNNFKNTTDCLIPFATNKNFDFLVGDVTDDVFLHNVFSLYKPDFTLHAAALVGAPICARYKELANLVNIEGTGKVVQQAIYFKSKLLFCSTGSVYAPGQGQCREQSLVAPPSHYGKTKWYAEQNVLCRKDTIVHRYGTAMGASFNNIRVNLLVNDLLYQSYTNKTITLFESTFLRSFIHVRDIASAIVHTFENWDDVYKVGRLFNVSNNSLSLTKGELANMIAAKLGTHVCYADVGKDADQRNYVMDNSLFYSTGWEPKVSMEETLDELIKVAPMLSQFEKYK